MRSEIPGKVGKIPRKEGKQKGGTERRNRDERRLVSLYSCQSIRIKEGQKVLV